MCHPLAATSGGGGGAVSANLSWDYSGAPGTTFDAAATTSGAPLPAATTSGGPLPAATASEGAPLAAATSESVPHPTAATGGTPLTVSALLAARAPSPSSSLMESVEFNSFSDHTAPFASSTTPPEPTPVISAFAIPSSTHPSPSHRRTPPPVDPHLVQIFAHPQN